MTNTRRMGVRNFGSKRLPRHLRNEELSRDNFTPRTYQVELLDSALRRNTIICMGPSGRIFIAVMLMKEMAHNIHKSISEGGKRTVFLVNTEDMVQQQMSAIQHQTDMKILCIEDEIPSDILTDSIDKSEVLVVTGSKFLDILQNNIIRLDLVNLLVFDDCHLVVEQHPYQEIMKLYKSTDQTAQPRVLGLTSAIITVKNQNPEDLGKIISAIENGLQSIAETSTLVLFERYGVKPKQEVIECADYEDTTGLSEQLADILETAIDFLDECNIEINEDLDDRDPRLIPKAALIECHNILRELGPWCAACLADMLIGQIEKIEKQKEFVALHKKFLKIGATNLRMVSKIFEEHFNLCEYSVDELLKYSSPKVTSLMNCLRKYRPETDFVIISEDLGFGDEAEDGIQGDEMMNIDSDLSDSDFSDNEDGENKSENFKQVHVAIKKVSDEKKAADPFALDEDKYLCGLVFVDDQHKAFALNKFIEEVCAWDEGLCFVKSMHLTGKIERQKKLYKKQEEILRKFRMQELNLLVSTNILEEGVDIPKCNFVCRFDVPKSYKSYSLSKSMHLTGKIERQKKLYKKQEEILRKFRMQELNLLVTTNILEEGVDIPKCNFVCRFDVPKSYKSYSLSKSMHLTGKIERQKKLYKKQEEILRKFRMQELNLLVSTNILEEGVDIPKCNFVCRFDVPKSYKSYSLSKGRARARDATYTILIEEEHFDEFQAELKTYREIEQVLIGRCRDASIDEDIIDPDQDDRQVEPYVIHAGEETLSVNMDSAIMLVNRYCAKLPSDAFTHLTPSCRITQLQDKHEVLYRATLRLPINSPIKQDIEGLPMKSKLKAKQAVALKMCEVLHKSGELDDNLMPIGKEMFQEEEEEVGEEEEDILGEARPGTTKRKQYYCKKVAGALLHSGPSADVECRLYMINMTLTGAITDEQNTRGRRIYAPEETPRGFGILTPNHIPQVPLFPVFTRSGEVTVSVDLVISDMSLSNGELEKLQTFHRFLISNVLRLEKDPMEYYPEDAPTGYIIVPLVKQDDSDATTVGIDWGFTDKVVESQISCKKADDEFIFKQEDFEDAVVMPSYRNMDQPQYFYVAEIRQDLNPESPFPSPELYKTFAEYYTTKYGLKITNVDQPLLDVDHTSARLNLLVPRYMNQKGVALPVSSAETKKARRENLQQKQILVPELCEIHVFPASLWRKAVCLPAILYRMNYLLLAEEIRKNVAMETKIGIAILEDNFRFPRLDFGFDTNPENLKLRNDDKSDSDDNGLDDGQDVDKPAEVDNVDDEEVETNMTENSETDEGDLVKDIKNTNVKEIMDLTEINKNSEDNVTNIDEINEKEDSSNTNEQGMKGNPVCDDKDFTETAVRNQNTVGTNEKVDTATDGQTEDLIDTDSQTEYRCVSSKTSYLQLKTSCRYEDFAEKQQDVEIEDCYDAIHTPGYTELQQQHCDTTSNISSSSHTQQAAGNDAIPDEDIHIVFHNMKDPTSDEFQNDQSNCRTTNCDNYKQNAEHLNTFQSRGWEGESLDTDNMMNNDTVGKCDLCSAMRDEIGLDNLTIPNCLECIKLQKRNIVVNGEDHEGDEFICNDSEKERNYIKESANKDKQKNHLLEEYKSSEVKNAKHLGTKNGLISTNMNKEIFKKEVTNDSKHAPTNKDENHETDQLSKHSDAIETIDNNEDKECKPVPDITEESDCHKIENDNSAESFHLNSKLGNEHVEDVFANVGEFGKKEVISEKKCLKRLEDYEFPEPLIYLDEDVDMTTFVGPSPCIILQALTMSNANDFFSLERLETIGDSFLKYAITVYLYCSYPGIHEGKLSYLRSKQVSNYNLYRLGKRKGLAECMISTKFEPYENWLPPTYTVNEDRRKGPVPKVCVASLASKGPLIFGESTYHQPVCKEPSLERGTTSSDNKNSVVTDSLDLSSQIVLNDKAENRDNEASLYENTEMRNFFHDMKEIDEIEEEEENEVESKQVSERNMSPYCLQIHHCLPDKSIADCVEALIGCYLTSCDKMAALRFMSWMGLKVLPVKKKLGDKQIHHCLPDKSIADCVEALIGCYLTSCDKMAALRFMSWMGLKVLLVKKKVGDKKIHHCLPDKSIADCVEALIGCYLTSCDKMAALRFMSWMGLKVLPVKKKVGDKQIHHCLPDKSIADCVEALIGCYLTSCDKMAALRFMSWMGLKVLPVKKKLGDKQIHHCLPDKSIADCVEALIGCYLTSCDKMAALRFMSWMGLKVLPVKKKLNDKQDPDFERLPCPPSPFLDQSINAVGILEHLLDGYEGFERKIGYTFKDRSYLLQAFTHASYHYNTVTDCYQRLEFLGDAVLDYVITRHLYEDSDKYTPGVLTDLRSALVNNNIFAALAVKWDFHKYFKAISPSLFYVIEKFVARQKENEDEIDLDEEETDNDQDKEHVELEVPKALGDIFESVAGAIYLDSGMSLDAVWRVFYRIMKTQIDKYLKDIPKSPVRELLEQEPETAKFDKPERTMDGKIRVTVNVVGKGVFTGVGRNYRIAKSAAAKKALRCIKTLEQQGLI